MKENSPIKENPFITLSLISGEAMAGLFQEIYFNILILSYLNCYIFF